MNKFLSLENVNVNYGNFKALNNINFEMNAGELIFITGANGSGKSTFIKTIAGLIKIASGKILKPSKIAYVPQIETADRDFPATVFEIVITGMQRPRKLFYTRQDKQEAKKIINALGLENLVTRKLNTLSGGQYRRVFLARALCGKPELLLLDEPCAGLDIKSHRDFYDILAKINSYGTAIMIVTHDKGDFNEINYNRIIEISDGRILN